MTDSPLFQSGDGATSIDPQVIGSVEVALEAVIGSATLSVAQLTALTTGSIVEFDAPLDTPVDLRLNGITVARGELVALGDAFAVRVSDIGA